MALITTDPFPVVYALLAPLLPSIKPPVGKSGPGIISHSSFMSVSGLSMSRIQASVTSERLWGGIFVAIPTAIPPAPLTSKFGNSAGKTIGSLSELS